MGPREERRMGWIMEGRVGDLTGAIAYFESRLPGWWFSVGVCHVSADATVAPDRAGCDAHFLVHNFFDSGIDCDMPPPATMAKALRTATDLAFAARDAYYIRNNIDDAMLAALIYERTLSAAGR